MAFVMSIAGTGWGVDYTLLLSPDVSTLEYDSVYPENSYCYPGRNYKAVYTLPDYKIVSYNEDNEEEELSKEEYSITWDVRPDENSPALDWLFWEINSNDKLILTGILPEYDENNYSYYPILVAKVSGVDVAESLVYLQGIDVAQDYSKVITSKDEYFEDFVTTDKRQLSNADSKYSVNVQIPHLLKNAYTLGYDSDIINLPDWLSYDVKESKDVGDDETEIISTSRINIYFKKGSVVEEGTEATVTVPVSVLNTQTATDILGFLEGDNIYYATLQWNVTYTENAMFKFLTSTDQTFSLEPGDSTSYTFSYTGSRPKKINISSTDGFNDNITVPSDDITVTDKDITVTFSAKPTAKAGTYTATLTFTDAKGNSDTAKITVEVKASTTPTTPTNPTSNDEKPEPEPDPEHEPENIETKSEDVNPIPEDPIIFDEIESGDKPSSSDEKPAPTPTPSRTSRDIQPGNNNNNNNTNNNISSNSQKIVGVSATPKQSTMNINNATIKDNVANALGMNFGDNEGIKTIKNQGKSRTIEDENVKKQISQISGSEDVKILVFPLFEFESGVTVFALNYSDFEKANIVSGEPIRIHPTPQPESASELSSSIYASANDNFKLLDSSGKEINVLPSDSNEEINVAAYVSSSQIYSILVYSGGNSAETVSVTITSDDITPSALGPSGAGCDTGINFATLLIVVAGFIFRKKLR